LSQSNWQIYAAYLYHASLEEDLFRYRSSSSETAQKFTFVWLQQVLESASAISVGFLARHMGGSPHFSVTNVRTIAPFVLPGASQVLAKACTALALAAGLSFPVAVLCKSAKIVPVMLGQLVLGGVTSYSVRDYLFVTLLVAGTALLSLSGSVTSSNTIATLDDTDLTDEESRASISSSSTMVMTTPAGLVFMGVSLLLDGVTAGLQKDLKRQTASRPPTSYDFLFFSNLSMFAVAAMISMQTGDVWAGQAFLQQNPECVQILLSTCLCAAVGQFFIFYIIANFDPLVLSSVTTTRKILTVLLSILFKGHALSGWGVVGLSMTLTGLVIEIEGKLKTDRRKSIISSMQYADETSSCVELGKVH
jgi:solute carrier family 35 (UDP-galactose transporter), member B1